MQYALQQNYSCVSRDSFVYLKVHHFKIINSYIYTVIRDREFSNAISINNLTL
jgi:hypothetical protein